MTTVQQLDTEITGKIVANLAGPPTRMINDFNDEAGEIILPGAHRFRQRLEVLEEEPAGSNVTLEVIQADIDFIVRMERTNNVLPPRLFTDDIWLDQQQLVKLNFWTDMVAVFQVRPDTTPAITEDITQNGELLIYTLQVFLHLQP